MESVEKYRIFSRSTLSNMEPAILLAYDKSISSNVEFQKNLIRHNIKNNGRSLEVIVVII